MTVQWISIVETSWIILLVDICKVDRTFETTLWRAIKGSLKEVASVAGV